jgi:hypothetical protein
VREEGLKDGVDVGKVKAYQQCDGISSRSLVSKKAGLDTRLAPGTTSIACREKTIVHQVAVQIGHF